MKPAVAYLRVSSKKQAGDDRTGYKRQEQLIRAYAKKNKYKIIHIYKEQLTGTETERPVFQQMVADLVNNGAKTILIESFDRFTRDVSAGMQLVYYLAAKELNLINCANNANVTQDVNGNPMQKAMVQFTALIAETERNLLVYRMRKGRDIKSKERGHRIEGPPSQYSREFRDKLKKLKRTRSWSKVAAHLNSKGETTCNGEEWTGPRAAAASRGGRKAV